MHAASTSPARARGGVALAADVVAVQADADVEAPHGEVARPASSPASREQRQREQCGLGRVDRAGADRRPRRSATDAIGESARTTTTDVRSRSVSRIAMAAIGDAARLGQTSGAHPRERRVPGDVDAAVEQVLDLALVVRVEDVVEGQVLFARTSRGSRPRS